MQPAEEVDVSGISVFAIHITSSSCVRPTATKTEQELKPVKISGDFSFLNRKLGYISPSFALREMFWW